MKSIKRYFVGVFSLCFILLVNTVPAFSQTTSATIFGPKQYDKPKGKPVTYTDTFQATSTTGTYTLWAQSGSEGLKEVKNVSVSVNGVEIIGSRDLRNNNPASKVISVQSTNTLSVTLKGQGENYLTVKILCDGCFPVQIDFPKDNFTLSTPFTMIKGAITPLTAEVGVVVNGVLAQVVGNEFIANHIHLTEGWNTITAEAADIDGNKAQTSIKIYAQPTTQYVKLTSNIESGISPLEISLKADSNILNPIASTSLTYTGNSTPTITTISPTEYKAIMNTDGLYVYTITITDNVGNTYQDTIGINVMALTAMDNLLKGKWEGMRGGLSQGNVEKALMYIVDQSQKMYRYNFELMSSILPTIVQDMGNITLVKITDNMAEYEMTATQDGQTLSFYVEFVRDMDGIWRIRFY